MMNTPMPSPGPAQGSVLIPCFPSLKGVTANQGPRVYFICAHLHLIVPQTHVPLRTHHGQHRAVLRCLSALEPLHTKQGLQWNLRKMLTSRCAGSLTIMVFCTKNARRPGEQTSRCMEASTKGSLCRCEVRLSPACWTLRRTSGTSGHLEQARS
ncbi:uncharacterized protein AAEQ78_027928 isoform 6-T6 [Lycaon pictus]